MRNKLILFLLISFLLHLLLVSAVDMTPEMPDKDKPVSVSIVPKEKKPEPEPAVEPEPEKKPEPVYEDIPLDEDLETDVQQSAPVPEESRSAKAEKPSPKPVPVVPDMGDKQEVAPSADVEVPKVERRKELTKDKIKDMLSPDDIIQKYAEGGGMPEGEDYVSMQYVRLRYQSYFYKFARRLYQVWLYPQDAALRGEQGTVRISFTISRDGMISSVKVVQSSGYPDLDREAVVALKKTAGVPLPESYELNFLKVDAYFKYVLNEGFYVY